ncbi:hypothetical protein PHLGIDRAFT_123311, partial [Phlebiopsis gigantea 11061_1 CR5-6]
MSALRGRQRLRRGWRHDPSMVRHATVHHTMEKARAPRTPRYAQGSLPLGSLDSTPTRLDFDTHTMFVSTLFTQALLAAAAFALPSGKERFADR